MNVLSCFDGLGGGRIALERAGIEVDSYHAFEIDKYAIQIATKNYPDIIELGDITQWKQHKDNIPIPDLIIAGSPCQGFSNAGKGLNFDDPRSKLFFVFVDILNYYKAQNPNLKFMLENVKMKKEWQDVISSLLGVEPIKLNSDLVSAQSRERCYWTTWKVIEPQDKNVYLKDIIFPDADIPALHNIYGGFKETKPRTFFDKSPTIRTSRGGGHIPSLVHTEKAIDYMNRQVKDGRTHWDFEHHSNINNKKSACITSNTYKGIPYNVLVTEKLIRKFHPIECERLQTLPDDYTKGVSNTQRYKMLGVNLLQSLGTLLHNQAK